MARRRRELIQPAGVTSRQLDELAQVVHTLASITGRRDELLRRLAAAGLSTRELAPLAGVSHTTVARIIREGARS